MAIRYFSENCDFPFAGQRRATSAWLNRVIAAEGAKTGEISVIFCPDDYLLAVNRQYLGHDYFTDIITFDYTEPGSRRISGDLMISIDTVRQNAEQFGVPFRDELDRVIVHGVLHLLGYGDKTEPEAAEMRKTEDKYLSFR